MPGLIRRLATSSGVCVAALAALELHFRGEVAPSDVTPFRLSRVEGLPCELRPGFRTVYKGHEISINGHGFRGPEPGERREGVPRIALVGDSFTFGTGVADADTLSARLEDALRAAGRETQVLNFGVPGYTATNVAAVVVHKALPLDVDAVVYVFYANDVDASASYDSIPSDARIDTYHGFPMRSAFLQWTAVRVKQAAFALGVTLGKRTPEISRAEYAGGGGERVREALRTMRDACEREQVPLLFACYPFLTSREANAFRPIDELALADAQALGIATVDLRAAFGDEDDLSEYWVSAFDQHPDGRANTKVAATLVSEIARLELPVR